MNTSTAYENAIEGCLALHGRAPHKPVINLEALYDYAKTSDEPARVRASRSLGYLSFLSGVCGYTYGTDIWSWGVDRVWSSTQRKFVSREETRMEDWNVAMNRSSSTEMMYMYEFFKGLKWWELSPRHNLIQSQAADACGKMVLAKSDSGELAVAYLPDNANITIDMSTFPGPMDARWFNPKTSISASGPDAVANSGQKTFNRPSGWEDALLVLTRE